MYSIMKKTYLFCLAALTLGLTACDNYFDEKQLDNGKPKISVVETHDYTLTSDDYKTIADNKQNKAYAQQLDSLNDTDINVPALARVGSERYFNEVASADLYIPTFIYNKYPQLDPGSTFNVTYLTYDGTPAYLDFYNQTVQYTLTNKDYKAIWGDDDTKYLTPATESKVTDFLPMIEDNYLIGVKYAYSSREPNDGGMIEETKEVLYIYEDGLFWKRYVPTSPTVNILPEEASEMPAKWLSNKYPYAEADDISVLMTYDSKSKFYQATEWYFDGFDWIANTGVVEETLSFVLNEGWAANLSTYYRQAVAGDGNMGKITLYHYDLEDGISYIWRFDNLYGMRGSAYVSGPHYGEGWFVTPKIKLKNSISPALSFEQALNYGPTDDTRAQQVTVWVSTDFTDNVRSATWVQLPWNEWDGETGLPDSNSWTFFNSGRMDLSAWNGQTIYIGFCYKTKAGETCPTWEVKNILVNEPEENKEELDNKE